VIDPRSRGVLDAPLSRSMTRGKRGEVTHKALRAGLFEILNPNKVRKARAPAGDGLAHLGLPRSIAKKPHAFRKMDAGSTPP